MVDLCRTWRKSEQNKRKVCSEVRDFTKTGLREYKSVLYKRYEWDHRVMPRATCLPYSAESRCHYE